MAPPASQEPTRVVATVEGQPGAATLFPAEGMVEIRFAPEVLLRAGEMLVVSWG